MRKVVLTCRNVKKAQPYADALRVAGIDPVLATPEDRREMLPNYHGLLLTGGTDIDPSRYGQVQHPMTEPPDRERDAMEISYLFEALQRDLPVLAICRGLQLMNVAHRGGDLRQHIEGHSVRDGDPAAPVHDVRLKPGTRLARVFGVESLAVNSRHHQAAGIVARRLRTSAVAPDGVIEGLERPDRRFVVAVQWHPEDQVRTCGEQRKLFEAFAAAL
jgi:gamma-glutamyl-gamma-aminobutyrate hydrolase PuuD